MSSHDHDLPFLTRVYEILDDTPRAHVVGRAVADDLGISHDDAERVLARLLRDDHLCIPAGAPRRLGSSSIDMPLQITAGGASAATSQRL